MGDRKLDQNAATGSRLRFWAITIPSFAVQAAAFLAYGEAAPERGAMLIAIACLFFGQGACAFVHECGHAFAAVACRWRVILFVVQPIGINLPNRDLALIPKGHNDGAGGWVTMVPRAPGAGTARRWAIILAAGPIASFLLVAFALLVWPGIAPAPRHDVGFGLGLGLQALYGGLFSLLPGRDPGTSDGDKLRGLARDDSDARMRSFIWLSALLGSNVRLRAVPEWMIAEARAAAVGRENLVLYLATIEIGRTLDQARPDVARARSLVDAYRAQYGADGWIAACDAWLAAMWEGNPDRAKAALAAPATQPGVPELTFAAEAAIAARTGDAALARSKLEAMEAAVKRASPFRNPTFEDIGRQIGSLLP
jgi:hypothetical protein